MANDLLLPCPNPSCEEGEAPYIGPVLWSVKQVVCDHCGLKGPSGYEPKAIELWNALPRASQITELLKQRGKLGAALIRMMSDAGTDKQDATKGKANLLLNEISFRMAEANKAVESEPKPLPAEVEHEGPTMTTYDLFSGKEE